MIKRHGVKYSVRRYSNLEKGFTKIPNDIFKVVETAYQLSIYTYLWHKYDKDCQYASPSLKTIAEDTHISVSTVRRVIKELEDLKLIKVVKFDKENNDYINNRYYVFYPIADFETNQEENNLYLSEEQLAEINEIENGVYESNIEEKSQSYIVKQKDEMKTFFNNRCAYSGRLLEDNYSIDHIIPSSKGGSNLIWNLVPMYKPYNSSKGAKDMLEWYTQQEFYSEERLNKIYEWIEYAKNKWGRE